MNRRLFFKLAAPLAALPFVGKYLQAEIATKPASMPTSSKLMDMFKMKSGLWEYMARPEQHIPSGDWDCWVYETEGRGAGATRTGAETVRQWMQSGKFKFCAVIFPSYEEARFACESNVDSLTKLQGDKPVFSPTKRQLVYPNGGIVQVFSAEQMDRMRGLNFDCAWIDRPDALDTEQLSAILDILRICVENSGAPKTIITGNIEYTRSFNPLYKSRRLVDLPDNNKIFAILDRFTRTAITGPHVTMWDSLLENDGLAQDTFTTLYDGENYEYALDKSRL